jgi:hypothetical protein
MLSSFIGLGFVLVAIGCAAAVVVRSRVVAQPDEWLLCIRNGALVKAGVGISLWRRPGDVVARFTSTMQRVGFTVDALSRERLRVSIDGFILWSVSPEGDGPFRAFQKLGLVSRESQPRDLKSSKHLLATPQHRAFQRLLGAAAQRLAAKTALSELLLDQDTLRAALGRELAALEQGMGIRVDQIEIQQVRPADDDLLRQMSAEVEERVRDEAASVRLATNERAQRRALESKARIAEEEATVRRAEMERKKALELARIEHDREVKAREEAVARERALTAEDGALELARAVLRREESDFAARLDRVRREAEANRDAMAAVASAEEQKSQRVRDHELARLVTERVGDALKALPLHEARWVTVGRDSPAASIAGMITAAHELVTGGASLASSRDSGGGE